MATTVDTSGLDKYERLFKNIPKDQRHKALSDWGKKGNREGKSKGGKKRWASLQKHRMTTYIETSFDMAIQQMIETVQFDIKYRFMQEIDRFYDDKVFRGGTSNEPAMYDRTGSLELAFKPIYHRNGNTYVFGGEINGNNIPHTPYYSMFNGKPVSPKHVFDQFYYLGKHGDDIIKKATVDGQTFKEELWKAPVTKPSPSFMMSQWWNLEYKPNVKYIQLILLQELSKAMTKNKSLLKKG